MKTKNPTILIYCVAAIISSLALNAQTQQTNKKPVTPETTNTTGKIDADARAVLDKVETAYADLNTVEFAGQITVNIDVPGDLQKTNQQFSSSFEAPNKFRHKSNDGLVVGSTGEKTYIFNEKVNSYVWLDSSEEKLPMRDLPQMIPQILQSQNPALLFTLSAGPVTEVAETFGAVKKTKNVVIGNKSYLGLEFTSQEDQGRINMAVDPDTHLVRQFIFDFKPALQQSGATNVRSATVSVDYATIKTGTKFTEDYFAWTPPKGAFDLREPAGAQRPNRNNERMKGRAASHFTLDTIEGKRISTSDFDGQVVVLEFWATWCPPCVESLAQLSTMRHDLGGNGVKVFAINVEEDKDRVQTFVELKKINLPVLLDERGAVAKKYNVNAIPQTVVIGKDGRIKQVLSGLGDDTHEKVREAVAAAQREIPKG
jgi:peroxiredoxin/outer membrane lipoprotein-sorting protein